MNDRSLDICKGDDMHSDASPEGHAMTTEVDSFAVIKPPIMVTSNSEQKEEEFNSGADVPSTKRGQYFSTPVQKAHRQWAIDPQENPLGYKSFFSLECDQIVHQLRSKAVQDWSASKRKLEELDISTIEAEPLPLLCYTPKSLLDETTCHAKRRRIDCQGDEGNFSLCSCLTKPNSPGLGVQGPEKVHEVNQSTNGDKNSIQEKSTPHFNSESQSKRRLFLKTSRTARPQSNLPANREKSVPKELRSGACSPLLYYRIHNKMKFQNHESPAPALEFRSFFAAECEKICNQLKRHDTARMMFGDVSSIEAEPPPVRSATINSTIILELDSICKENSAMGVSQLDLEKMNINYSISERAMLLQKASDTVLCNSDASGPKEKVMVTGTAVVNTTHDIYNEESAHGAMQGIKIVHGQVRIADIMQDIGTMHDEVTDVDAPQDMVTMHKKGSTADPTHTLVQMPGNVSPADSPQANVRMCDGMSQPCVTQDIVNVLEKVPIANTTQDIMCDVSIGNGTQVLVAVGDWASRNAIPDNLTKYSKIPFLKEPSSTESSDFAVANVTQDIRAICNTAPDVEVMQNMRTTCKKNSAADATQEVMNMFNGVCRTDVTHEIMTTVNLSKADVTVDIGTMWATGTGPEDKGTDILHPHSESATQRNIVVDAPLQNVTLIKNANVVNYFNNMVLSHPEMTQDSGMYKTFTQCKVTEPNVTYDVTMNRGMTTNTVQDRTQLLSYKDPPNILPDISRVDDEKPKMNATQTLMSMCNEVTAIDGLQDRGDLTKVIATNCTLLDDLAKNVYTQPEKHSRQMWSLAALAHSSPRSGRICNMKDSTYNLDLTEIAHDESVFYNGPISFITSTPLPSLGNRVLIKKSCGLPVKSNPSLSSGQQDDRNKVILGQRAAMTHPSVTGQSIGSEPRSREVSQGVLYPNIPKRLTSKVVESRMPQPAPRRTFAVLKTPLTAKALFSKKDQVALGRINMNPPLVPTSLPRKHMQYPPGKSGASSSILQQQNPVNCARTGKDFFKKETNVPRFPASSLVRPPFGLSTPGYQMYAAKVQNIPGLQTAARVCKLSSVHPSSATAGFDPSGSVWQEHTFIRPTNNPVGSQISSKLKPRVSGLPVRKSEEAFLKPETN